MSFPDPDIRHTVSQLSRERESQVDGQELLQLHTHALLVTAHSTLSARGGLHCPGEV